METGLLWKQRIAIMIPIANSGALHILSLAGLVTSSSQLATDQ